MAFLRPDDGPEVAYEFFAPFAHVPGRYEWCRIRSATHGVFDTFIVLGATTSHPATVYVNSSLGAAFMQERYPECTTVRVQPGGLRIEEAQEGRRVTGTLVSDAGPVREASMSLVAGPGLPRPVPYGGEGQPVWGSRWTCWGVDLAVEGVATGRVRRPEGVETLRGTPCIITLGSFGRLAPRA
ncbi:MAG: hypothetical protein ACYDBQ_04195 [Thermoplasmatota archaeon]